MSWSLAATDTNIPAERRFNSILFWSSYMLNVSEKAVKDGSSDWVPASHMGTLEKIHDSGLSLTIWQVNHPMKDLSVIAFQIHT